MMCLALDDSDAMPVASYDQKSHVASNFNHLDLANAVVPLMTWLASCDTDTSSNTIT